MKAAFRIPKTETQGRARFGLRSSGFGLLSAFFRPSTFGLRICPAAAQNVFGPRETELQFLAAVDRRSAPRSDVNSYVLCVPAARRTQWRRTTDYFQLKAQAATVFHVRPILRKHAFPSSAVSYSRWLSEQPTAASAPAMIAPGVISARRRVKHELTWSAGGETGWADMRGWCR